MGGGSGTGWSRCSAGSLHSECVCWEHVEECGVGPAQGASGRRPSCSSGDWLYLTSGTLVSMPHPVSASSISSRLVTMRALWGALEHVEKLIYEHEETSVWFCFLATVSMMNFLSEWWH